MSQGDLPFTVEEYRTRLKNVQANMAAADIEVLLVTAPENIFYLTGYHTVGYFSFQMLVVEDRNGAVRAGEHAADLFEEVATRIQSPLPLVAGVVAVLADDEHAVHS